MDCSEINFVSSQHFYGIAIAKGAELPSLTSGDDEWLKALDKLNRLAKLSAERQIESNKEVHNG